MNVILDSIDSHATVLDEVRTLAPTIQTVASELLTRLTTNGTVYFCGNGGSAADSQHLAAELVGRFRRERRALPSIALSTDTSVLTCVGNDYCFEDIFRRQVEALVNEHDILIGISTSGNSENVIRAIDLAKERGALTVGLVGRDGGKLARKCDHTLLIPSDDTARIQEMHILIGHILCELIDADNGI